MSCDFPLVPCTFMNYLAHAYLSFGHPEILMGNMISDFVKGKTKFDYPAGIQKGIALHRMIDNFTDTHVATKEAKEFFRPAYRLYSGAMVDVVYDHFLAADANEFTEEALLLFSAETYTMLETNAAWMPPKFAAMFPYMKEQNWLFNYRTRWGTEKSLGGLVRRAAYLTESETAFRLFEQHYQPLQHCYRHFWADMKAYARQEFDSLRKT
jgi:acyl carrier protein phosphodiesterase